jgi:hypothetical protein
MLTDTPSQNIMQHFGETSAFIREARNCGGSVFLHCVEGKSRSAACVIAFLIDSEGIPLQDALGMVKSARPIVRPNEGFLIQLQHYEKTLRAGMGATTPLSTVQIKKQSSGYLPEPNRYNARTASSTSSTPNIPNMPNPLSPTPMFPQQPIFPQQPGHLPPHPHPQVLPCQQNQFNFNNFHTAPQVPRHNASQQQHNYQEFYEEQPSPTAQQIISPDPQPLPRYQQHHEQIHFRDSGERLTLHAAGQPQRNNYDAANSDPRYRSVPDFPTMEALDPYYVQHQHQQQRHHMPGPHVGAGLTEMSTSSNDDQQQQNMPQNRRRAVEEWLSNHTDTRPPKAPSQQKEAKLPFRPYSSDCLPNMPNPTPVYEVDLNDTMRKGPEVVSNGNMLMAVYGKCQEYVPVGQQQINYQELYEESTALAPQPPPARYHEHYEQPHLRDSGDRLALHAAGICRCSLQRVCVWSVLLRFHYRCGCANLKRAIILHDI